MKRKKSLIGLYLISAIVFSQVPKNRSSLSSLYEGANILEASNKTESNALEDNGYSFEVLDAGVSSKYSEFCSGFFRNKVIMVSSKKLGPLAKTDPNTGEGYQDLYCLDVAMNGRLSRPLLFSRILNTKYNEGQLSFSPDEHTVYYTRSTKKISNQYQLYKAELEKDSHGNWINEQLLSINMEGVSIENPYVNKAGNKLYFSANLPDSFGGFDLYVCDIMSNGELTRPVNLGSTINTIEDEKYPSLSKDSKYLYFSSRGHLNFGGYDVFESKILKNGFSSPHNMGITINTKYDEVAFIFKVKNKGYVTSNRRNGKGGYNVYTAINKGVKQKLKGKVLDTNSQSILPNSVVILKDEDGNEVSRYETGIDGAYSFNVKAFDNYSIAVSLDGFNDFNSDFRANIGSKTTYIKNLELTSSQPNNSVNNDNVERELRLLADNILFDSNKSNIKKDLYRILNKIIYILNEHPQMRLAIDAHTDNVGNNLFNLKLSNDRAYSVLSYLINNGISKERLQSKGYGETKPVIDCKDNCTQDDYRMNRRVELIIINK